MRRRSAVILSVVMSVIAAAAPAVAAGQSLTGETLMEDSGFESFEHSGECDSTTAGDKPLSQSTVTYTYTMEGVAAGPYTGTFNETGTYTLGPEELYDPTNPGNGGAVRPVLSFNASFEINAYDGAAVTGVKKLDPNAAAMPIRTLGICVAPPTESMNHEQIHSVQGYFTYDARIDPAVGDLTCDRGTGFFVGSRQVYRADADFFPGQTVDNWEESFISTSSGSCGPQVTDDCAKGAWRSYPGFKNQGDCVAFVATSGRNEPGRNLPGLP